MENVQGGWIGNVRDVENERTRMLFLKRRHDKVDQTSLFIALRNSHRKLCKCCI